MRANRRRWATRLPVRRPSSVAFLHRTVRAGQQDAGQLRAMRPGIRHGVIDLSQAVGAEEHRVSAADSDESGAEFVTGRVRGEEPQAGIVGGDPLAGRVTRRGWFIEFRFRRLVGDAGPDVVSEDVAVGQLHPALLLALVVRVGLLRTGEPGHSSPDHKSECRY